MAFNLSQLLNFSKQKKDTFKSNETGIPFFYTPQPKTATFRARISYSRLSIPPGTSG